MTTITKTNLTNLLAELVQMPTVTSEKATSKAAVDWFKYQVRELPLHVHDYTRGGYASVLLTTRPTKTPALLLHAHLDVVPGPTEVFQFAERDGRYHGRGVFDMKLAAAAYLKLLLERGPHLADYDLGISLTTDEEATGGIDGVRVHMEAGWRPGVVINPDSIQGPPGDWRLQYASKGTAKYRVTMTGQSGHGSIPWAYRSAITDLMTYLGKLTARFPAEPCGDSKHHHSSVNIGRIEGGSAANQVAASASAELDFRFMPDVSLDDIEQLMLEASVGYPEACFAKMGSDKPVLTDPSHPEMLRLGGIIEEITGRPASLVLSHGSSESAHFADHGIPVLMFSPPGGGHHSDTEWLNVPSLAQFYDVIRRYVDEIALAVK